MPTKTMGSMSLYMTPAEAAEVLGVSVSMVQVFDRKQLLEAYYPEGPRAKRFRSEDVMTLAELREQYGGDFLRKLPQIALRASVTSRRVEKKLEELMNFLGINEVSLGTEKIEVEAFHLKVQETLGMERVETEDEILEWAKKLLPITEEYLELVHLFTGAHEPWRPYLDLARALSLRAKPGSRARAYIDHTRRSLRNASYFFERSFHGPKQADRTFPNERYSGRILQRILPDSTSI